MIISAEMETFKTKVLCKTILTTIYNIALLLDPNLVDNLPSFKTIFSSLISIAKNSLYISIEEILDLLRNFNQIKHIYFLIKQIFISK